MQYRTFAQNKTKIRVVLLTPSCNIYRVKNFIDLCLFTSTRTICALLSGREPKIPPSN